MKERRKYLRHKIDIPVDICMEKVAANRHEYLTNISVGGLCFKSKKRLKKDTIIKIEIPLIKPVFEARGKVVWCRKKGSLYHVGLKFMGKVDKFKMHMVEQICYITQYKEKALKKEGRKLNSTQAALEWIKKNACNFTDEPQKPEIRLRRRQ
ncbi:PilZ domain-containing protein [Elusimicrobiota bacterium]